LTVEYPADWHADTDFDKLHYFNPQAEEEPNRPECMTSEIQYGNEYADKMKTIDDYVEEIIKIAHAESEDSEILSSEWTTIAGHRAFLFTDRLEEGILRDSVDFMVWEDVLSVECMYEDESQRDELLPVFEHMVDSIKVSS